MKYFLNKWRAAIISPYLYYLIPRLLNRFLELHIFYLFFHRYNCRFFFRFTFADTPSKRFNAFSTRFLQCSQVMPSICTLF